MGVSIWLALVRATWLYHSLVAGIVVGTPVGGDMMSRKQERELSNNLFSRELMYFMKTA